MAGVAGNPAPVVLFDGGDVTGQPRARWSAAACLLAVALFVIIMALLPNGATTLQALAEVVAKPAIALLLVWVGLGWLPGRKE